jgi:hypothetical protein
MERIWDPVIFKTELKQYIGYLAAYRDSRAARLLTRAAQGLVDFNLIELRPDLVIQATEAWNLKSAEACLALFPAEV